MVGVEKKQGRRPTMRLLLVEDEEKLVQIISLGLKAEGFAVDNATDGSQGLGFVTSFSYDLIILDLMLPRLSGTELLSEIRRRNRAVPIIILTAKDAVADKVKHLEA